MTTQAENLAATKWAFSGLFIGSERDEAGTPIGDICTGYFVTFGADPDRAAELLAARYAGLSGTFRLRELKPLTFDGGKDAARIARRGGTKKCPLLA